MTAENNVGRHRHEVVDAFRHRVLQIRNPDLADNGVTRARTGQHMDIWHGQDLPSRSLNGREARADQILPFFVAGHARAATC